MSRTPEIVCVGSATWDTIALLPKIPGEDTRVLAEEFVTAVGGPAAIAAITLARLGTPVAYCGVVGDDEAGRQIQEQLVADGVNVDAIRVDPSRPTARSIVLASAASASRTIITTPAPVPADVPLDGIGWVHADQTGFGVARAAISRTTERPRLSVDAGNPVDTEDWNGVELYAPSLPALLARYRTSDPEAGLRAAREDGAMTVVATDGARGSWYLDHDQVGFVPGFPVEVVSSLGAGDVFHGALLAALLRGADLAAAVRQANAAGALACRSIDGGSAIPDRAELERFLSDLTPGALS